MIRYLKATRPSPTRIDTVHPTRPRPARAIRPDADGVIRLRAGESIVLRRTGA